MNKIILIKTCSILSNRTIACYNSNPCNLIHFMCKLHKKCATTPNYMVKVCSSKFSSSHIQRCDDKNSIENFEPKIIRLCKSPESKYVVNLNVLTSAIEDLENDKYSISETLSQLLLNWCGKIILHNEPIKIRQELIDRIWDLLKAKKCKLTINDYHALLQAYIDSNYIIDTEQFLKDMTVPPEYDTYCLLLQVPSTNDCTFADDILSKVQQNTLPACSKIYDALKYAYATNENVEGILKVINLMQNKTGISLSAANDVYLLYALVKKGKLETVINILKTNNLSVSDTMKLVKLISFAQNNLSIEEILRYSQPLTTQEEKVNSTIVELVYAGHVTNAYKVATCINTEDENIKNVLAHCLLREMIKLHIDPEILFEIIRNFEKENFISNVWEESIKLALEESNNTVALKILDEIKARGVNVDLSYFMPLLKYKNENDLYSMVARIINLNIIEDHNIFLNNVCSAVDSEDPITTVIKMVEHGIPTNSITNSMVKFLVDEGRLQDSIRVCKFFKKHIDCQEILDSLFIQYKKTNDIDSCIHFLFELSYNGIGFVSKFLRKMIDELQWKKTNIEHLILLLNISKEYKVVICRSDAEYIKKNIAGMNIDKDTENLILQLISDICLATSEENYNTELHVHPQYMNLNQLYDHLHELKSNDKNTRGVLRKILMFACKVNRVELVEEMLREIENIDFKWTPGMKLSLFGFYVKNKMIENALQTLNEIACQFKHFQIDNFKILRLAILLIEEDKIEEAFDIIKKHTCINHKPNVQLQINQLLDLSIKNCPNDIKKMIDLLCENGYCDKYYILKRLIYTQLDNNIQIAVNAFEMVVKKYRATPGQFEILSKLVKLSSNSPSKYDGMMKKVVRNIKSIHGTHITNVFLVLAYAQCNNKEKLEDLFKTCSIREYRLMRELKNLNNEDILKIASTILEMEETVSKSFFDFRNVYSLVLSIYDKQGDVERASELRKKYLEKYPDSLIFDNSKPDLDKSSAEKKEKEMKQFGLINSS